MISRASDYKQRVAGSFNRAANSYDKAADLQRIIALDLMAQLKQLTCSPAVIADIGAGSGLLSHELLALNPSAYCYLVDIAFSLLNRYQPLGNVDLRAICADFDYLPLQDASIDLLFSSMSLQWSLDLSATLTELLRCVKKNALLAIALPVNGTLSELAETHRINDFHRPEFIESNLLGLGCELVFSQEKCYQKRCANRLELLKFLKNTGANCLSPTVTSTLTSNFSVVSDDQAVNATFNVYCAIVRKVS